MAFCLLSSQVEVCCCFICGTLAIHMHEQSQNFLGGFCYC